MMKALSGFVPSTLLAALLFLSLAVGHASAQKFDRQDVTFKSQGLNLAAWYYAQRDEG